MVLQFSVPKKMRDLELGRRRLEFVCQIPADFAQVN